MHNRATQAAVACVCLAGLLAGPCRSESPSSEPGRSEPAVPYDVVVYGATSAGVIAAVQASRMQQRVVLVCTSDHVGGLTSSGLGWTDSGDKRFVGGLAREFYHRIQQHYENPAAWTRQRPATYTRFKPGADAMWTFEPHVARDVFADLLRGERITLLKSERLNRQSGLEITQRTIVSIRMESGLRIHGRMFIDATYEGDLMAAAGTTFTVGREANALYGEELNGIQRRRNTHNHRFIKPVDPYVVAGQPTSGLLPGIRPTIQHTDGSADHCVQAYCFRVCLTRVAANRVAFSKPKHYDAADYELLFRNFEAGDLRLPLTLSLMPNIKTDTNNNGAVSTDHIGFNTGYPEGSYADRQRILDTHRTYQQGLLWSLANHPRVPATIRSEMRQWGLCADEFTDTNHWPPLIYVREARRMRSDYVMTERDCRRLRITPQSIGIGSYNMDSHNAQRYVTARGTVQNEGDVQVSPRGPYAIDYRSIVPRKGEATNLLVPVCLSSSHIAYGSIRMEPVFMILGQSAATAAVQALRGGRAVQDVPYSELRAQLRRDGQVLDLPPGAGPAKLITVESLPGVVVDNERAQQTGVWNSSTSNMPFIESAYLHDSNRNKGQKSVRFQARLPDGRYEVRMSYSPGGNRATNVPVTVQHASGKSVRRIDQRRAPTLGNGLFVRLGSYRFRRSLPAVVTIGTQDTDGYVIADAIQFLPVK